MKSCLACFNPCCFGSLVRAGVVDGPETAELRFQSLLFWIIGSGHNGPTLLGRRPNGFQSLLFWIIGSGLRKLNSVVNGLGFQSLLFWIIGSGRKMDLQSVSEQCSFNPCCFGSLVRAHPREILLAVRLRFQSLLFWIIGSGLRIQGM